MEECREMLRDDPLTLYHHGIRDMKRKRDKDLVTYRIDDEGNSSCEKHYDNDDEEA